MGAVIQLSALIANATAEFMNAGFTMICVPRVRSLETFWSVVAWPPIFRPIFQLTQTPARTSSSISIWAKSWWVPCLPCNIHIWLHSQNYFPFLLILLFSLLISSAIRILQFRILGSAIVIRTQIPPSSSTPARSGSRPTPRPSCAARRRASSSACRPLPGASTWRPAESSRRCLAPQTAIKVHIWRNMLFFCPQGLHNYFGHVFHIFPAIQDCQNRMVVISFARVDAG